MKTIVNKIRFALLLGFIAIGMTAMAQAVTPNAEKLSISTQMFLDEMAGKISLDAPKPSLRSQGKKVRPDARPYERPIAKPDTIDGRVYISSILNVTDKSCISALESLGVIIECTFDNGIVTALIPVDAILDVAAIDQVKRVKVAEVMHSLNDNARRATNADDVLAFSNDARLAGLSHGYDGTGVILGVIDSGIDFQHIAFKDKNGNSRIKGLLCYTSTTATANPAYDWQGSGTIPAYDKNTSDHGTHTSSIAGGSSVIVSGTNVTVTDDHANATYGGMAPGADMYLAGLNSLYDSRIIYAMRQMYDYAEEQGKPLVVSNSWGSLAGPHDGTDDISLVVNDYFGDNHPNNVCLFAAGNNAGNARAEDGGGLYISATASSANPLRSILRTSYYSDCDGGDYYVGTLANAWCRTPNVTLGCRVYVLDNNTGAILSTVNVTPTAYPGTTVNISTYYTGTLTAYSTTDANGKSNIVLTTSTLETKSENKIDGIYHSDYTLAVEFYPANGSAVVDVWADSYSYFSNCLTTNGYNWVNGTDNMSVGVNAVNRNAISVGAYVSRTLSGYSSNDLGDISSYSSYATAGSGPLGDVHPTITAPGQFIISAYNHNYSSHSITPVVNNATNPYGYNGGTSMACPAAAGIVALWLQTAQELGKNLTTSEIKNIMIQTAIHDAYTNGANASHFGNGKIDALAGIEYILREYGQPMITASPTTVTFEGTPGGSYTETVTVGGMDLTGDITATLSDPSGCYSISATNLGSGGDLVITYSPTGQGTHNATITLTSPGVDPVTITINGTAIVKTDATICDEGNTNQYLPVYGYYYDEAQVNQMLYPASKFTGKGMEGNKITKVTFYPTTYGSNSGINFYSRTGYGNGTGTVTVKLANMPANTAGYTTATRKDAQFVTVKTIAMPNSAQTGLTEWVFENLENEFVYTGGDLLIEVTTEVGMYGRTYFAGESQTTNTGMYSYGSTAQVQQFLPKVKFDFEMPIPVIAGTVSPTTIGFTNAAIDQETTQTITVTNTGNTPFAPVIDTTNLPTEFTVTGNGTVPVGGSIELTVTYLPTDEGPHSGTFTVTIDGQTYTVTVSGNGVSVTSTLTSNMVEVPVFRSAMRAIDAIAYQISDIDGDTNHNLPAKNGNGDVEIEVLGNDAITGYDLMRQSSGTNWTTAATATHDTANSQYAQDDSDPVSVADGASEWMALLDNSGLNSANALYVPVTNATSVQGNPNTYGAMRQQAVTTDMSAIVNSIVMSSSRNGNEGHTWTVDDKVYTHYTITLDIDRLVIPTNPEVLTEDYDLYKVRVWRQVDLQYLNEEVFTKPNQLGGNRQERISDDFLMEEVNHDVYSLESVTNPTNKYYLGQNEDLESFYSNWTLQGSDEVMGTFGAQKLREEASETGVLESLPVTFIVRAYYTRTANLQQTLGNRAPKREGEDDGKYYIVEYTLPIVLYSGDSQIVTSVGNVIADRHVVDVQYVNTLGMQSSQPFEGVNIVVTRYSDGTFSTRKVVK